MDTLNVSQELRPYIPLFLESILACPVKRDGKLISYENVVTELECDTVEASSGLGLNNSFRFDCGHFSNAANLMLKVDDPNNPLLVAYKALKPDNFFFFT